MKKTIYLKKYYSKSKLSKFTLCFLTLMFGITDINAQTAPGNVATDLKVWYKADVGVTGSSSASNWADQSGNGNDVSQATAGDQPATGGMMNYNPALIFNGTTSQLEFAGSRFIAEDAEGTVFGAATNDRNIEGYQNMVELGSNDPHLGSGSDGGVYTSLLYNAGFFYHTSEIIANQPHVFDYFWNGGDASDVGGGTRMDGLEVYDANVNARNIGGLGTSFKWTVGSSGSNTEEWEGMIGEIILYDRNLTSTEKDQVDTYLGIKYGTSLSHNYLAGDGSTIYDVSTYGNDVAGIGREDAQGLMQKQSMSVNSGNQPAIAIGDQTSGL